MSITFQKNMAIKKKKKRWNSPVSAVASCQWWLIFAAPCRHGIFDQACYQFFLTARKDTNGSTVLLQDQLQQGFWTLMPAAFTKNKVKNPVHRDGPTTNKRLFYSSNGRGACPHRLTHFKKLGCRISGGCPLALGLMLTDRWTSKKWEEKKLFWQGLGVPGDPANWFSENWQYVRVNLHPEDLNERVSESVRLSTSQMENSKQNAQLGPHAVHSYILSFKDSSQMTALWATISPPCLRNSTHSSLSNISKL